MADRSAGEEDFLTEYTRSLLPSWGRLCIEHGHIADVGHFNSGVNYWGVYTEKALEKGWITKAEPRRLTAAGFKAAASFLRR